VYGRADAQAPVTCAGSAGLVAPLQWRLGALGLAAQAECVSGPFWVAYLLVADKTR
jgi:hypothetical protein